MGDGRDYELPAIFQRPQSLGIRLCPSPFQQHQTSVLVVPIVLVDRFRPSSLVRESDDIEAGHSTEKGMSSCLSFRHQRDVASADEPERWMGSP